MEPKPTQRLDYIPVTVTEHRDTILYVIKTRIINVPFHKACVKKYTRALRKSKLHSHFISPPMTSVIVTSNIVRRLVRIGLSSEVVSCDFAAACSPKLQVNRGKNKRALSDNFLSRFDAFAIQPDLKLAMLNKFYKP